jgi:hypothetical protein
LAFAPNQFLYVAEAGTGSGGGPGPAGLTGSITEVRGLTTGRPSQRRVITGLASIGDEGEFVGPDGISILGTGEMYIIVAQSTPALSADVPALAPKFGWLLKGTPGGATKNVADIGSFNYAWTSSVQNAGFAPPGQFPDSNPYAVLAVSSQLQYVIDAGANTLNEVGPNGEIRIVAYFPNPFVSDAVPTCVAKGSDGYLYVGTLALVPNIIAGPQSKVYRVSPSLPGIQFLTAADVWASGFHPITGCGFGPGGFYVTEFSVHFPVTDLGDVVKIAVNPDGTAGARTVMGAGVLHHPNGFAAGPDGSIYVSNNSTSIGTGEVVRVNH